jgi:hypothetical protein
MDNTIINPKPRTEEKMLKINKTRKLSKRIRNAISKAIEETKPEQKRENRQSTHYSGLFLYTKI